MVTVDLSPGSPPSIGSFVCVYSSFREESSSRITFCAIARIRVIRTGGHDEPVRWAMDAIDFLEGVWVAPIARDPVERRCSIGLNLVPTRVESCNGRRYRGSAREVSGSARFSIAGSTTSRDLDQEVKIAYEQLRPPAPVRSMATDPYRGLPLDERVDDSEAKQLLKQAQDHHYSKEFAEARAIYQDIVERFPRSKQAVTADQQIKNLKGL